MKERKPSQFSILRLTKSFYFIVGLVFVVWMVFFDGNSLINQVRLQQKHQELQDQHTFYTNEIEEMKRVMSELSSNPELLEKFAREEYLFKRKGEDVYVIEKKEK